MVPSSTSTLPWISRAIIFKDLISEEKVEIVCPSEISSQRSFDYLFYLSIVMVMELFVRDIVILDR